MEISRAVVADRASFYTDVHYIKGQFWLDSSMGHLWILQEIKNGIAIWFNATKSYYIPQHTEKPKKIDPTPIVSAKYALQELQRCIEKMEDIIKG
jgi:hypothetical protein